MQVGPIERKSNCHHDVSFTRWTSQSSPPYLASPLFTSGTGGIKQWKWPRGSRLSQRIYESGFPCNRSQNLKPMDW
ncbi:hypothetical protein BDV38DRAFT_240146 [Aspergillus pseudotamarii]|uniref:Uncharacterized protein n=1 Tax=Aspergillus pseudotamarii TaxID=132259 RepID=A0A5N6SZQ2_ASPPS|nr:uncharacterized protein BDV38DRAFT_240146 [Aspergillus pseudotamarii]KAE8140168.1 hypothetical protein BDV38DRAFT_240146 [Aspergillus pseudotamarii]